MSKADEILMIAEHFTFVREVKGKPNHGRWVEALQRIGGTSPGQPWCACFVSAVLGLAYHGVPPLPYTASCDVLLEYAKAHDMIVDEPERGDLFLVLKTPTDATHVGFVMDVSRVRFGTIEGNASDPTAPPTREGWGVFERLVTHSRARRLDGGYAFVRFIKEPP